MKIDRLWRNFLDHRKRTSLLGKLSAMFYSRHIRTQGALSRERSLLKSWLEITVTATSLRLWLMRLERNSRAFLVMNLKSFRDAVLHPQLNLVRHSKVTFQLYSLEVKWFSTACSLRSYHICWCCLVASSDHLMIFDEIEKALVVMNMLNNWKACNFWNWFD